LIGDRSLQGVANQKYTAEALSDSVCWEVRHQQFQEACNASAPALAWVTEQLERRLAEVERRIELISFARVEIRILALLRDLAEASVTPLNPQTESIQIPLSQSEIAQLIGATRETASTTLNQFERRGLLRLGRRQIEVVSIQSIRDAASGRDQRADGAHA
jgi:CRP-like cAMP-binding protein